MERRAFGRRESDRLLRGAGRASRDRLLDWDSGSAAAERLAAQLLVAEGFKSVDPSHPLGGPDGLKDAICTRDGKRWVAGAYFPHGPQRFGHVKRKFVKDAQGVAANDAQGFVFITNQELSLSEREQLKSAAGVGEVEILHLERLSSILNQPQNYGVRLEFLDIEMTRDEQVAFVTARDVEISALRGSIEALRDELRAFISRAEASARAGNVSVPLAELQEFKSVLDKVTESNTSGVLGSAYSNLASLFGPHSGNIHDLRVQLKELQEFAALLDQITGRPNYGIAAALALTGKGHVDRLSVPLAELQEYEKTLDRVAEKCREAAGVTWLPKLSKL